jgi:hypothetical protein
MVSSFGIRDERGRNVDGYGEVLGKLATGRRQRRVTVAHTEQPVACIVATLYNNY